MKTVLYPSLVPGKSLCCLSCTLVTCLSPQLESFSLSFSAITVAFPPQ